MVVYPKTSTTESSAGCSLVNRSGLLGWLGLTQNCEQDVDQEISTTASLEEDTQRRQDDGKDELADVAGVVKG